MKTFKQQVEDFLENVDVMAKSKRLYASALRQFQKWVVESGRDIQRLQRKDIIAYKAALEASTKTEATIDIYLLSVRLFYKFKADNEKVDNIAENIKRKRRRKSYCKESLTEDECTRLLNSIDRSNEIGKRNFAIIYLMLSTGLRCVEVARLLVGDLQEDHEQHYLLIQRKREIRKQTRFGIPMMVARPILDYLKTRPNATPESPMFAVEENQRERAMSPKRVGCVVKNQLVKAKVYSPTKTTHSLRHTAAVRALDAGISIYDIMVLLGHSDVKTTQRYLASKLDERQLQNPAICPIDLNSLKAK